MLEERETKLKQINEEKQMAKKLAIAEKHETIQKKIEESHHKMEEETLIQKQRLLERIRLCEEKVNEIKKTKEDEV